MQFRFADSHDCALLGQLNAQLIRDEGHRNAMTTAQLAQRMAGWLTGEYRAVLFESDGEAVGYTLFRRDIEHVYVRQFFVCRHVRRRGIGRQALAWLWEHAWKDAARLRIDVLVGNTTGIAFWRAVGFVEYCVTMEATRPAAGDS